MKNTARLILGILAVLLSLFIFGCSISETKSNENAAPSSPETEIIQEQGCRLFISPYDWELAASYNEAQIINEIPYSELTGISADIAAAMDGRIDECKLAEKTKCDEYRCIIRDAIRKADVSACRALPLKVKVSPLCNETMLHEDIQDFFGINYSDYVLNSSSCNYVRGGGMKATGTFKDGKKFEVYYREGWCSSGGTDCGVDACFSIDSKSKDTRLQTVQDKLCNEIISFARLRLSCLAGNFTRVENGKTVFSIGSRVETGKGSCFKDETISPRSMCEVEASFVKFQVQGKESCEKFASNKDGQLLKHRCYSVKAIVNNDSSHCNYVDSDPKYEYFYPCKKDFLNRWNQ